MIRCAACKATVLWVRTTGGLTIAAGAALTDGDLHFTGDWARAGDGTEIPVVAPGRGGFRRHRDVCPVPRPRRWSTRRPRVRTSA